MRRGIALALLAAAGPGLPLAGAAAGSAGIAVVQFPIFTSAVIATGDDPSPVVQYKVTVQESAYGD